jgi:hypothetical protein
MSVQNTKCLQRVKAKKELLGKRRRTEEKDAEDLDVSHKASIAQFDGYSNFVAEDLSR